jgi:predicted DNA-binding ribbon-helix-helix protein
MFGAGNSEYSIISERLRMPAGLWSAQETHGYFMHRFERAEINKRSIEIDGRRTSVSLEDAFWIALKKIAATHNIRTAQLIAVINRGRKHPNLSSAIRLFVLHHYREQANSDLPYATYSVTKRLELPSLIAAER